MGKLVIGTVFDFDSQAEMMEDVKEFILTSVVSPCDVEEPISFEDLRERLHYSNHICPKKDWKDSIQDDVIKWVNQVETQMTMSDCIELLRMFGMEYSVNKYPIEELFRDDYKETFVSYKDC